jgi:hypothetical protein
MMSKTISLVFFISFHSSHFCIPWKFTWILLMYFLALLDRAFSSRNGNIPLLLIYYILIPSLTSLRYDWFLTMKFISEIWIWEYEVLWVLVRSLLIKNTTHYRLIGPKGPTHTMYPSLLFLWLTFSTTSLPYKEETTIL